MTAQQKELLDRLFEEAVVLPPYQQKLLLTQNSLDPEVRAELETLLAFDTGHPPTGIVEAIEQTAVSLTGAVLVGHRVGPYRLLGRIGQGGMGTVYRAARADDQFQQTVVIKLLRFAQGEPVELQRFRRERQILASLQHPHIAGLLDGGAWIPPGSAESQPYIVMEYVEGLSLNAHCNEKKLSIHQRLVLFRKICDALSYAHRRLVIHRDIKPGNILVTLDGEPKLLDFGIAKLLDPEIEPVSGPTTAAGQSAMTPDYASPEQIHGDPVSTITDVYSLGAVLYEMLTGRRAHQLASHDPLEMAREICEREMQPPSLVGGRQLRGDLDVIVLKALQKEPARRYQSVEQFSEDIRRYLEGLPIIARPDTLMYRTAKFAQRHRLALIGLVVVFVALTGGIVASTWQAIRASRAEQSAKAVNDFLENDVLARAGASTQSEPSTKPDPDLKVRTALDRAAARIAGKFTGQPLVEASIRHTIANAYLDLGLFPEARRHLERAIELRARALGEEHPVTLSTEDNLGELYWRAGNYSDGEKFLTKVLEVQRRVLGESHPDTVKTMDDLGTVYDEQGKSAQAEALYTRALAVRRRLLGDEHPQTLNTMNNLAVVYKDQGKYAQAEAIFAKVLKDQRRLLGEEHPDTLSSMSNLGGVYFYEDKYTQAEPLLTKAVEVKRRVLGEEHLDTLGTIMSLAALYGKEGKYAQAEQLNASVLEVQKRVLGIEHPLTLSSMNNLAMVYQYEGKYTQAESLFARLLEVQRHVRGEAHPDTLSSMNNQALLFRAERAYSKAKPLFSKVLEVQRRVLGAEHPDTLITMDNLGMLYLAEGEFARAETLLANILAIRRRLSAPTDPDITKALSHIGNLRVRQQRYADAEPLLREAGSNYEKSNLDTWPRYHIQSMLGAALAGQKKYPAAEPLLLAGYQGMRQRELTVSAESRPAGEQSREWIVRLYQDWKKPAQAAEWRNKSSPKTH